VGLLLVRTGVGYLSNRLHGLESWSFEYAVRGLRGPDRFGFLLFVPLQLALIWVQCLAVSVVAMLIAWRSLSGRQVLQLATWLMPFSLVGGLFTILYEHAWYEFLGRWLQRDSYTIEEWMDAFPVNLEPFVSLSLPRDLGQDLLLYGNDLALGLLAGLAAATVLRRRRWLIALASAALLAPGFWLTLDVQRAYATFVYEPIHRVVWGPRPQSLPDPQLWRGPTFKVGAAAPVMAGRWELHYGDSDQLDGEMTFDSTGAIVLYRQRDESTGSMLKFIVDGASREMTPLQVEGQNIKVEYRAFGAAKSNQARIVLHTRVASNVYAWNDGGAEHITPYVFEETFVGTVDADGTTIAGDAFHVRDCPFFKLDRRERSFVLRRVAESTPPNESKEP
jgi:type IV secretory pathway TrbD component